MTAPEPEPELGDWACEGQADLLEALGEQPGREQAAAALASWYLTEHRWTPLELDTMAAALAAPTVDDALDAWFGDVCRWRADEDWAARSRAAMRRARAAAASAGTA